MYLAVEGLCVAPHSKTNELLMYLVNNNGMVIYAHECVDQDVWMAYCRVDGLSLLESVKIEIKLQAD